MSAEALILDFGGVISRTLFETHALSEAALGLPTGSLTWQGPFAPQSDDLWQSMQAGKISEREYWHQRTQEVAALAGRDWREMSDFVIAARGADPLPVIRPEALAAIAKARDAGKRLAILSNELDLFYGAEFREKLPFLKAFDVIVDATYTGILKPDPRAYAECLAQLGLPAETCVFVDDQPRNIEGARAVGLACVAFDVTNPIASYRQALSLLGL
ncbi:MAG: HAD-IA family hydrolase [Rhodobacteraceae bacterium]|nr:HAD-IA family hydrolase [Paracoccaceae bacterium]